MFTPEQQSVLQKNMHYILGGIRSRIHLLEIEIKDCQRTVDANPDDTSAPYRSLRGMIEHSQMIVDEYKVALKELTDARIRS